MAQRVLYNNNGRPDSVTLQPSSVDLGNVTNDLQIPQSIVTAKGDIITATGNATPVRQAVGSNGQIIVGDSNLTNGLGYKDPAFRNWVMNGNFDIAQRGTSFTNPSHLAYVADRWKVMNDSNGATFPSSIVLTQEKLTSGDIFGSFYLRSSWNGELSNIQTYSRHGLLQYIEHGTKFLAGLNKKVTVTFYARSSKETIADKRLGVYIYQAYGTGGSPSSTTILTGNTFTLSSSWEKYSYTFTTDTLSSTVFGTNNDNHFILDFMYVWGSGYSSYMNTDTSEPFVGAGNIDIAQVALYAGDVAYPFEPVPFDIELQRCMRYYEKSYNYVDSVPTNSVGYGIHLVLPSNTVADYQRYGTVFYKVPKRIVATPVIYPYTTATNTGRVSDDSINDLAANSGRAISVTQNHFVVDNNSGGTLTLTRNAIIFNYSVDADF
jgi:hypothetical protein